MFSALSSSVSTLFLLLISCLIPLPLFIYMLMTHNSIFLFPLLISSLVSLLSLLLSILSSFWSPSSFHSAIPACPKLSCPCSRSFNPSFPSHHSSSSFPPLASHSFSHRVQNRFHHFQNTS